MRDDGAVFHNVDQNTSGWLDLRAGKVTGSSIAKVMANIGKAFGEPAKKLAVEIALHRITGHVSHDNYTNSHMDRGHAEEPVARVLYEEEMFYTVDNGGFFDNGFTGCSPDGLVENDGVIEIKSVIPATHYATIKRDDVDPAYKWQHVFNLHETGREWIDFISYCSLYPLDRQLYIKRKTVADYASETAMMKARLTEFAALVDETEQTIRSV